MRPVSEVGAKPELLDGIGVYSSMNRNRYRVILPLVTGCISGLLMIWDLHNVRVVESMGMARDIGPPVWPYEVSWIALLSINAPAYALSTPLFLLFNARNSQERFPLFFPLIIAWWSWLGRRIDSGLFPSRGERHRWGIGAAFTVAAIVFYYVTSCSSSTTHASGQSMASSECGCYARLGQCCGVLASPSR